MCAKLQQIRSERDIRLAPWRRRGDMCDDSVQVSLVNQPYISGLHMRARMQSGKIRLTSASYIAVEFIGIEVELHSCYLER